MSQPDREVAPSVDLPAIGGGVPVRDFARPLIFGAPEIGAAEIDAVTSCLRSGWIGAGPRVEEFEREFARYKGVAYAAAVSSGTAALHLTLVALGIGPGDEVIAPTMTFASTIHSIVHTGARPVLVDCTPSTLNIDPRQIERCITARTKAIIVVHMAGRCCEMSSILDIARRHELRLVEDCAHALEAVHHGRPAGTIGDAGCFSFYPTKSIATGDSGMVIVSDKKLHRKIKILSTQGMMADAWTRNRRPHRSRIVAPGFKYNMTDISAALGLAQLPQVENRWARRRELWNAYNEQLRELPLAPPAEPERHTRHAYHLYSVVMREPQVLTRRELRTALRLENIGTGIHFEPVHREPYYRRRFGFDSSDFPVATSIGESNISLPLSSSMDVADVAGVCRAMRRIWNYFEARRKAIPAGPRPDRPLRYALPER